MAGLASWLVSGPLLREGHAEVEHGMLVTRDVSHEDTHLAGVNLAPVATPLALDAHCMCAAFGKAARIEGEDAIGCTPLSDYRSDQHGDQWPMIPEGGAHEVLQDLSLDIDQGGDLLGMLAVHVGQQPLEGEVHMAPAGLGLQSALGRHDKIAQAVHHGGEHVGGNDAVPPSCFLPLCPRWCHLFASSHWHADSGRSLEAIDTTRGCVMQ